MIKGKDPLLFEIWIFCYGQPDHDGDKCIGGVMVSMLASSAVEHGFEPQSGQTKHYKIVFCLSAKHAALRRKSKDWLARNLSNVSEWSDMSTCGLLFQ